MRRIVSAAYLSSFALAFVLAACGASDHVQSSVPKASKGDTEATQDGPIWLPTFHAKTAAKIRPECESGIDVKLSIEGESLTGVLLSNRDLGPCRQKPNPNQRFYELKPIAADCGSRIYYGYLTGTPGPSRIKLIDHSHRRCEGGDSGLIEIEEVSTGKGSVTYRGDWQH